MRGVAWMSIPDGAEYMTATQARLELGISKAKLAQWLADKTLPSIENPFNKRSKLVRRGKILRLAFPSPSQPKKTPPPKELTGAKNKHTPAKKRKGAPP